MLALQLTGNTANISDIGKGDLMLGTGLNTTFSPEKTYENISIFSIIGIAASLCIVMCSLVLYIVYRGFGKLTTVSVAVANSVNINTDAFMTGLDHRVFLAEIPVNQGNLNLTSDKKDFPYPEIVIIPDEKGCMQDIDMNNWVYPNEGFFKTK